MVLNTTAVDLGNPANLKGLEKAWADKLDSLARMALEMSQKEVKADFFQFAVAFRRQFPGKWKEQQDNWEQIFSDMLVTIRTEAVINSTDKSTEPQGRPEQKEGIEE